MNYTQIRKMDIANGEGIRVSLFVQGCEFYCEGCFNADTWNFKGGREFTDEILDKLLKEASKSHIDGITILGGEPLHPKNVHDVERVVRAFKESNPSKTVWIYSGYTLENMNDEQMNVVKLIDVLVDGQFVQDKFDLSLKFRGSSNQRVIDVQRTLKSDKATLYLE